MFYFFGYPEHYLPLNETSDPQFLYNSLLKFLNMKLFKNVVKLTDYSLIFQDLTIYMIQYIQRSLLYWTYSKICINWRLLANLYYPKPQHIKIINLNDFSPGKLKSLRWFSTHVLKKKKVNRFSESLFWIFNKLNCNQENVCRGVCACTWIANNYYYWES